MLYFFILHRAMLPCYTMLAGIQRLKMNLFPAVMMGMFFIHACGSYSQPRWSSLCCLVQV